MNDQILPGLGLQKMIVIYFKLIHQQSNCAECVILLPHFHPAATGNLPLCNYSFGTF
jgi:hypothetical protein